VAEWQLPKLQVEGSNPFARSRTTSGASQSCDDTRETGWTALVARLLERKAAAADEA
jgi:hypothetical protein